MVSYDDDNFSLEKEKAVFTISKEKFLSMSEKETHKVINRFCESNGFLLKLKEEFFQFLRKSVSHIDGGNLIFSIKCDEKIHWVEIVLCTQNQQIHPVVTMDEKENFEVYF